MLKLLTTVIDFISKDRGGFPELFDQKRAICNTAGLKSFPGHYLKVFWQN